MKPSKEANGTEWDVDFHGSELNHTAFFQNYEP